MDLRKLPGRESEIASPQGANDPATPGAQPPPTEHTQPPPPPAARRVQQYDPAKTEAADRDLWVSGPEALLHIGFALVIAFVVQNPFRWFLSLMHLAAPAPSATDTVGGMTVVLSYEHSLFFVHDMPIAMLALGLVFEAVAVGIVRSRGMAWLAVGWTATAGLASAAAFVYLYPRMGVQLFPLIAAIVGGYVAWSLSLRLRGQE